MLLYRRRELQFFSRKECTQPEISGLKVGGEERGRGEVAQKHLSLGIFYQRPSKLYPDVLVFFTREQKEE